MPTALITGITGQDGGYLTESLLERGYEVHGVVHGEDGQAERFANDNPQVHLHRLELADGSGVHALLASIEPDQIYHLAGISSVALSWEQPLLAQQVNAVATGVLLDAIWRWAQHTTRRPSVVHASTAEIFGQPEQTPQDETTPIRPLSPYGATKAYAHHLVSAYRSRGLHASNTILFNHESPRRPDSFVTRKITKAAAEIAGGRATTLTLGNLDARRDWGWAPDYVAAMVMAAEHETGDDYVIATGTSHTVRDFVETAFAYVGLDWQDHVVVDSALLRPIDAVEQLGNPAKARATLGWIPTMTFHELIARMVDADRTGATGS